MTYYGRAAPLMWWILEHPSVTVRAHGCLPVLRLVQKHFFTKRPSLGLKPMLAYFLTVTSHPSGLDFIKVSYKLKETLLLNK
jgi:hypothetical protein